MVKIFEHPDISSNSPDGLLRRVFLWLGCCTACRGDHIIVLWLAILKNVMMEDITL